MYSSITVSSPRRSRLLAWASHGSVKRLMPVSSAVVGVGGEESEQASCVDRAELVVVADEDDFGAGRFCVQDESGRGRGWRPWTLRRTRPPRHAVAGHGLWRRRGGTWRASRQVSRRARRGRPRRPRMGPHRAPRNRRRSTLGGPRRGWSTYRIRPGRPAPRHAPAPAQAGDRGRLVVTEIGYRRCDVALCGDGHAGGAPRLDHIEDGLLGLQSPPGAKAQPAVTDVGTVHTCQEHHLGSGEHLVRGRLEHETDHVRRVEVSGREDDRQCLDELRSPPRGVLGFE